MQLSEEITGHPPTDDESIEEESEWILRQLLAERAIPPQVAELEVVKEMNIDKDDIGRVLTMMHVQKLDVSFFFFPSSSFVIWPTIATISSSSLYLVLT